MPKTSQKSKFLVSLSVLVRFIGTYIKDHPFISAFCGGLLYLLLLQPQFIASGDTWAETYYEYVHGAVVYGAKEFFEPGIAGYYNFLPKLLIYPYVFLNLSMEFLPNFLRISVIVFTVACIAFIAHKSNRYLIKSDWVRILTALLTLLTLYHITSFSFINVWYIAFLPIILVSLNPTKIRSQLLLTLYVLFTVAVCITKPSIIILPFIIYWAWRHREYLAGTVISIAIGFQTLLFFASDYYSSAKLANQAHVDILTKVTDSAAFPGLVLLKFLQIQPTHIIILLIAGLVLVGLIYIIARFKSVTIAVAFSLLAGLAAYTALFPPDTPPVTILHDNGFVNVFQDTMKLQREIIISILIVLSIGVCLDIFRSKTTQRKLFSYTIIGGVLITVALFAYRPIDTQASGVAINLSSFNETLDNREAVCMPIAPTPSWRPYNDPSPMYGWYYESRSLGSCAKTNYGIAIDYNAAFLEKIGSKRLMTLKSPDENIQHISSVLIGIANPNPEVARTFVLKNISTGKMYETKLEAKTNNEKLHFISFNLSDEESQGTYVYELSEKNSTNSPVAVGSFVTGDDLIWSYYVTRTPTR